MKKYLFALIPIAAIVVVYVINTALSLISQPSDMAVLAGGTILSIILLTLIFLISKVKF